MRAIVAPACVSLAGCPHRQRTRITVLTAGTVVDTQYQTVLNNLALMSSLNGVKRSPATGGELS